MEGKFNTSQKGVTLWTTRLHLNVLIYFLVGLSFLLGIYFYPIFPQKVASHWNAFGQVDGYMPKFWGLFLMPFISLIMAILFNYLPKIDPHKNNISKFKKYYHSFILLIVGFLFYIYLLTLAWNLGYKFSLINFIIPAFSVLFYYCGILLDKAKQNWFIGIKTPWTMSSERVWNNTHKLGAKLYKASALISLLGLAFPIIAIWLVIIPVIFSSIFLFIYSYLDYQKESTPGVDS